MSKHFRIAGSYKSNKKLSVDHDGYGIFTDFGGATNKENRLKRRFNSFNLDLEIAGYKPISFDEYRNFFKKHGKRSLEPYELMKMFFKEKNKC